MQTNTHQLFNTIDHEHLGKDLREITIVECEDRRWFVENNWGDAEFESFEGISNPHITPYVYPEFFNDREAALQFAIHVISSVIPDYIYNDD